MATTITSTGIARARRAVSRAVAPVRPPRRAVRSPALTVVIPVHNVEPYLAECLDSILGQTLRELEVIAVDDGSTDGSARILARYARRDRRLRWWSQANAGQGPARNVAVAQARGEFLAFVDADDTVPRDAYAEMVAGLRVSGSDFAVGSARRMRESGFSPVPWAGVHAQTRIGETLDTFPDAILDVLACNRVYRTPFWIDQVGDFRGDVAYEDHVPMVTAYVRARAFDVLSLMSYDWRIREDRSSTTQQKHSLQNLRDRVEVMEEARALLVAEASPLVNDAWLARVINVDFPPFIRFGAVADQDYRDLLVNTYRTYLDRSGGRVLDQVRFFQKARGWLVAQARWDDVERLTAYVSMAGRLPPATVVDERAVADLSDVAGLPGDLPPAVLRLGSQETRLMAGLTSVSWDRDTLLLSGWAMIGGVDASRSAPRINLRLVERASGERTDLPVAATESVEPTLWARHANTGYDRAAFTTRVDGAALAGLAGAIDATWALEVEVDHRGVSRTGPVRARVRGSSAEAPPTCNINGRRLAPGFGSDTGFTLRVTTSDSTEPEAGLTGHGGATQRIGDVTLSVEGVGLRFTGPGTAGPLELRAGTRLGGTRLAGTPTGEGFLVALTSPPPTGVYRIHLGGERAAASDELSARLPLRLFGDEVDVTVLGGTGGLRLEVGAPLAADEIGRTNQRRLQRAVHVSAPTEPSDVALFRFTGPRSTGSGHDALLEISARLRELRPDLPQRWAVADLSLDVPDDEPVVIGTSAYYAAIGPAGLVCTDGDIGTWLPLVQGRRVLRVFGDDAPAPPDLVTAPFEGALWDVVTAPEKDREAWLRSEYRFDGPVVLTPSGTSGGEAVTAWLTGLTGPGRPEDRLRG